MKLRNCIIKLIVIFLGVITALDLIWLFGAKFALNKYLSSEIIEQQLQKKTSASPVILNLKYKTNPDFSLSISALKVNLQQNGQTIVDIKNFNSKIKILPILFNHLYIDNLDIDELNLNIIKSKNGEINLLELLPSNLLTKTTPNIKNLKLNLKTYKITYLDENITSKILFQGNYFNIKEFSSNKKINIDAQGLIFSNNKKAKFDVNLNTSLPIEKHLSQKDFYLNLLLDKLDLSSFNPFVPYLNNPNITGLNGNITASLKTSTENESNEKQIVGEIVTQNLCLQEKLPEDTTYLKEKAKIAFTTNLKDNNLIVKFFNLKTPKHEIKVSGKVFKINTQKPILDLKLNLHNEKDSMIYHAIPSEINFENRMIAKIKKYKPKATVDGEITIKGNVLTPDIEGEFHASDLFIDQPIAQKAKATIKLVFLKDKLQVLSHVIPNPGTVVDVDGICELYGRKSATFKIKSGKNVELALTRAILMPIQDTFSLNFGILNQLMVEKGRGDASLYITGTREDAIVKGRLNFYNGQCKLDGINTTIKNISGYLNFKGKDADFATTSADIKTDKIKISGTGNLDGSFSVDLLSNSITTQSLTDILTKSPMLTPIAKEIKELNLIKEIKGSTTFSLNFTGKLDITNPKLPIDISKLEYKGFATLKNNQIAISKLPAKIILSNATTNFDKNNIKIKANTKILNSKINLDGEIKKDNVKIYATSEKVLLQDLIILADKKNIYKNFFQSSQNTTGAGLSFTALYHSKSKTFDAQHLNAEAKLVHNNLGAITSPKLYASQGYIKIQNGNIFINKLNLNLLGANISIDGNIHNFANQNPDYNLSCMLKNLNLSTLNNLNSYKFLGSDFLRIISAYKDYQGSINGWLQLKKSGINGKLNLSNIKFVHKKMQMPLTVETADLIFKNDTLDLKSLNAIVDNVPVFLSINIKNFTKKPAFRGYITSNIYPSFVNKYINANLGYPIKLKGEMTIKSYFTGTLDSIKSSTTFTFPSGSDLSYMGASLDEEDVDREIKINMIQSKNNFNVSQATYSKYITALSGKRTKYPYITASGKIEFKKNTTLNDFHIKTTTKTSSRFFNILFKKSLLKSGDFECDLSINGNIKKPKIFGFIKLNNLYMPTYQTTIKNILADFRPNTLAVKITGNIYNTNILANLNMDNKLYAPYHIKHLSIKADYFDLDNVFDSLTKVTMQPQHTLNINDNLEIVNLINPRDILIDNGIVTANKIVIKSFPSTDLKVNFQQNTDKILQINNFDFKIAEGTVSAVGEYDLKTNKFKGDCIAKSIDANQFTQIFLNTKNQIFGALDGTVSFNTTGISPEERIKNLNGKVSFIIKDGKMPKLGSLEYLLRAGNVLKSGITGFTINNIIELLVPIRTGEFSAIRGNIVMGDGKAKDIKIYSKGKNLSLYITGTADLITQNSQMIVYGKLSKKISTLLGPIGNTSLNTLFSIIPGIKLTETESSVLKELNKIPGLELSNDDYRFFSATIDGNINGENYVQTFKWID